LIITDIAGIYFYATNDLIIEFITQKLLQFFKITLTIIVILEWFSYYNNVHNCYSSNVCQRINDVAVRNSNKSLDIKSMCNKNGTKIKN